MSGDRGQAREFPAGRLAAGLAGDDDELGLDQILRPRARPKKAAAAPQEQSAPAGPEAGEKEPGDELTSRGHSHVDEESPLDSAVEPDALSDALPPRGTRATPPAVTPPTRRGRGGRPPEIAAGPPEAIKASTVQIPVSLLPDIKTTREAQGLTNGEIIIEAIEGTHERLRDLIHPPTTGGTLFAARSTKSNRSVDGPLAPLNVRLRNADWEVIDRLVVDVDAFSRGHLITVCLKAYYSRD